MSEAFKSPILVTGTLTPSGTQDVNIVSPNPLPVSGTFTPSGTQNVDITGQTITLAISAASLPLPTGASTEATLLAAKTDLDKFTFTSTRLLVDGSGVTQPISGSVSVSNFPATQPISGTITANQGTSPWVVSGTISTSPDVNVHDGSGVSISSTGSSLNVDVTNTIPVTGPLTDTQLRASPVPISGTISGSGTFTVVQPTGTNLHTVLDSGTLSGALPAGTNVIGHVITDSGSTTGVTGNVTAVQTTGSNLHVVVDSAPTTSVTQGTSPWTISGAVTNTPPANQSVNLAQLNGVTLGSPSNYGTSPGVVEVLGVNAFITNTPAVTLASTTITGTVAVTQSTSPWVVSLSSTTLTGTSVVAGNLTNNNAAPSTNNLGVLSALANAANPSWTEGDQVLLSEDLSGNLRVKVNSALPAGSNVIGHIIADSGSTTTVTGNITVVQGTGTNLHTVVDSGTITAVTAITNALPAGSNVIGHVINDSGSTTAVTGNVTVVQGTGTNLHTVIDSGTITTVSAVTSITNALPAGTNVIGHVITDTGSTTGVTGNVTVVQPTGTNLHTVVDSGSVSIIGTATSAITRKASSTTNQTLAASNSARKGLILYNDGTANQFVKFGATATITSFTTKLGANAYYELNSVNIYTGIVDCISSSTNGAIQVTEIS